VLTEQVEDTAAPKDDLFSRWLLMTVELVMCGVLSLLGTIEIYHVLSAVEYAGGKAETVNVMTMLADTSWSTVFTVVLYVFFAAVVLFAVPLFVKAYRRFAVLLGMLTVTTVFTVIHVSFMYMIIDAWAQKTLGGIPYETGLTEVGIIYLIVSGFAILELALALRVAWKQRKEEPSCNENK